MDDVQKKQATLKNRQEEEEPKRKPPMIIPRWDEKFGKSLNKLGDNKRYLLDDFLDTMGLENMASYQGQLVAVNDNQESVAPGGGAFRLNGALATPVLKKAVAYTLLATDSVLLADATAGAFTVTLPTAIGVKGRRFTVKKIDASANAVTVGRTGAETIDGATTKSLPTQYNSATFVSDGANWMIV